MKMKPRLCTIAHIRILHGKLWRNTLVCQHTLWRFGHKVAFEGWLLFMVTKGRTAIWWYYGHERNQLLKQPLSSKSLRLSMAKLSQHKRWKTHSVRREHASKLHLIVPLSSSQVSPKAWLSMVNVSSSSIKVLFMKTKCEGVRSERWSNSGVCQIFFSRYRQAMSIPSFFFPRTWIAGDSQQKLSRSSYPSVQKEGSRNSHSPNVWKTHRARKENTSKVHLVTSSTFIRFLRSAPLSCFIVFSFLFMKFD